MRQNYRGNEMEIIYNMIIWFIEPFLKIFTAPTLGDAFRLWIDFNIISILRLLFWFFALMTIVKKVKKWGENSLQHKIAEKILMPFAFVFIVVDILYNYQMSIIVWELPKHWRETVSERHGRYLTTIHPLGATGLNKWRYGWAHFWCKILDAVDENHCIKYAPPIGD